MQRLEVGQFLVAARAAAGQPHEHRPLRGQFRQADLLARRILELEVGSLSPHIDLLRSRHSWCGRLGHRLGILRPRETGDEEQRRRHHHETLHERLQAGNRVGGTPGPKRAVSRNRPWDRLPACLLAEDDRLEAYPTGQQVPAYPRLTHKPNSK